jgi:uncharacterized protein YndB with AHSA1/START domain
MGRVFEVMTTPEGLDRWWTERASGTPREGAEYELGFGPEYQWRARVSRCTPGTEFEIEMTQAAPDWLGTRVGFRLDAEGDITWVRFHHRGWPDSNEHYRVSCNCWAMYLRILRRYIEHGESVPYDVRLDA